MKNNNDFINLLEKDIDLLSRNVIATCVSTENLPQTDQVFFQNLLIDDLLIRAEGCKCKCSSLAGCSGSGGGNDG